MAVKDKAQFPIYIVSKGRWDTRLTAKALDEMNQPYYVIIDKSEYDKYASVIDSKKLLIQPQEYYDNYDMFWKDDIKITGAGSARNYAWDHSIKNGFKWHWVMDDNIKDFRRFQNNRKIKITNPIFFRILEDFCLRYENIAIAGLNYYMFIPQDKKHPPFILNTRIYSCLLIRNDIPYRWRGRYNEDTDLSLRVLKDGWVTIEFNQFLQTKAPTQTIKGGNTEQFYSKEGTYNKSKMLYDMHPDLTTIKYKFHRIHHHVDYTVFKQKLKKKKNIKIDKKYNNYKFNLTKNVKRDD